ncbi:helix-turn-helix transcriptional regulator [Streptomyces sp. KN37]|uniref:helix-turn-helix transcriptional regulator n=1 Tax=Streptomyces sp. KN37 TaxID=3090667 RepID=UPI002A758E19|nr:helix-turn-helix transcriptional regulator [Streptomyces sp. KN37]WPO75461.1 helix-turn-helix transcriptional regulator [Streptomyces sp. KN37]
MAGGRPRPLRHTQFRVRGAARLTIAAVATRCGFSSPSHFSRRFRAEYGLTPSEWRRARQE